jgi:hypothetical protein
MFTDLYDAISMLWSWRWPVAEGRVTEVLAEHIQHRSNNRKSPGYEFSVGGDGPYTRERFWTPAFCPIRRLAAARRKVHAHRRVRVRYRPDDLRVNRLAGGVARLLRESDLGGRGGH